MIEIQKERLTNEVFIPSWIRFEHLARYQFAAQYVKDKTIIDCACGDGTGSEIFLKRGAGHLTAFDLSESAIEKAKIRCGSLKTQFRVCGGTNLPSLPNQFADVYICLETIEHIEQDREFLKEVLRVIKSDGVFICSTPNRIVTNPGKSIFAKPWNRFHVREYSKQEFIDLLGSAFCRIEFYGQNPKHRLKVRFMETLGRILPKHAAVQLSQIMKLPWLIYDKLEFHRVQTWDEQRDYEYMVAVCHEPRR